MFIVVLSLLMSATGTTESTLIGAFACVLMASLLRQICVPGLSFAWSRQASVIAAVPLAGGLALLLAWRHGIATTTTLSGAMVLGASLLLAVSFTSTVGAIETGDDESGLPDAASVAKLVKARRSIFPEHYSGEAVSREALLRAMSAANWAPTHGKTEPWRFVVFQGGAAYSTLLDAKRRATERLMAETPELLASALKKMERKAKQMEKVGALIAICVKRVANVKGKLVVLARVVSVVARSGGERIAAIGLACLYLLWLYSLRVYWHPGKLMPEWEETAAVACAVQNMHLALSAEGLAGYWSSGGVMGEDAWANAPETRELLGMTGECQVVRGRVVRGRW